MEKKSLIISSISNLLVASLKILCGIFYNASSLFASGLYSISNFIIDILTLVGIKVSDKKPSKVFPFGKEYISNLIIGISILFFGIVVIIGAFKDEYIIPNIKSIYFILGALLLKILTIIYMNKVGKKNNSQLIINSTKDSIIDILSTTFILIMTLLMQISYKYEILKYTNIFGIIVIGLLIIWTSFPLLKNNYYTMKSKYVDDKKLYNNIRRMLLNISFIEDTIINIYKYKNGYYLDVYIEMNNKLNLKNQIKKELEIKKKVLNYKEINILYINVYNTTNLARSK